MLPEKKKLKKQYPSFIFGINEFFFFFFIKIPILCKNVNSKRQIISKKLTNNKKLSNNAFILKFVTSIKIPNVNEVRLG